MFQLTKEALPRHVALVTALGELTLDLVFIVMSPIQRWNGSNVVSVCGTYHCFSLMILMRRARFFPFYLRSLDAILLIRVTIQTF
jgi:hypothetical protein